MPFAIRDQPAEWPRCEVRGRRPNNSLVRTITLTWWVGVWLWRNQTASCGDFDDARKAQDACIQSFHDIEMPYAWAQILVFHCISLSYKSLLNSLFMRINWILEIIVSELRESYKSASNSIKLTYDRVSKCCQFIIYSCILAFHDIKLAAKYRVSCNQWWALFLNLYN